MSEKAKQGHGGEATAQELDEDRDSWYEFEEEPERRPGQQDLQTTKTGG